ncbi:uncharacterized protein NPIL_17121 [Nephila pilipes]|uniref:Uncharacterized protein n=1 Tax=Nephila pilipes TaxID=299642 RepID=A0A8X6NP80_NEPPI|nr:uncharacterized protein NPIL_17121 [Nephila pilipes]
MNQFEYPSSPSLPSANEDISLNEELETLHSPSLISPNEEMELPHEISPSTTTESAPSTSIEINPSNLNYNHQTINIHCVSPHEPISQHQMENLKKYVIVTGNQYRNLHFLALRFKNPVIIQKHFGVPTNTLRVPPETCILVDTTSPTLKMKIAEPTMLFTFESHPEDIRNPSEKDLLEMLFPRRYFVYKTFYMRTLFVISYVNPFKSIWTRARKNSAFHALVKMYLSCIQRVEPFTIEVASTMRFFKRNNRVNIENFTTWYPLAYDMTIENMIHLFKHEPTVCFARSLFQILKRSDQHVLPPHHPPPDFYTCQTTLNDEDPVGVACRIVDSKVEYVSVMILSYTKEWFLDTNNMSCCFVPTSRLAMCKHWFPLLKDKQTWETFGQTWYVSDLMKHCIQLSSLIDWVSIQTSEPYRHIRNDLIQVYQILLIQTLKKDISYDVTEAFTASQPLIDLYPELYRNSSSFLDFLFKLCHAPAPPLPSCQGKGEAMSFLSEDMRNFQKRLDVKEKEIESLQEELANKRTYYETEMRKLERKLAHAEKELKDYVSQKEYESEIHANLTADTVSTTPAGLFNHSNAYNITSQSPRCSDTLTPAITADSCSALNALEYPRSDECVFQKLKDWKQELWTFLNNFKTEMARDFTLTQERNQNIEQLLETLRPTQTPALPEIPVKPTVSVDDISEALFDKFEQVLTRRLSEEQLRSMLKTFKLDEHFDELIGKVKCILSNGSQSPKKVLSQIHETKVTVTQITKSLLQKISTLFGSQLPSLELMQHLDRLENELLVKNTQLAKTLEPSKVQHYCQTHLPTVGYSEDWEKRLIDHMEALTAFRQTFYDQLQIIHARFNLSYVPDGRPEEILMRLCDTTLQQSQDLERQLKDTTDQLHSIHQEMLEKMNLDPKSQTVMLRNSKHLETGFFEWLEGNVNMLKEKLETAYAQLEANEVPSQCVISEVPNLPSLCAPVVEEEGANRTAGRINTTCEGRL